MNNTFVTDFPILHGWLFSWSNGWLHKRWYCIIPFVPGSLPDCWGRSSRMGCERLHNWQDRDIERSAWKVWLVNTAHLWHTSKLSCREMWRHDAWQLWLRGVNGRYGSQFSPKCNDMRNHPLPCCSFAPSCHSMWSCLFSGLVQFFWAIWDTTFEPKPLAGVPLALSRPNGQQVMKSSNDVIEDNSGLSHDVLRHSSANLHQFTFRRYFRLERSNGKVLGRRWCWCYVDVL